MIEAWCMSLIHKQREACFNYTSPTGWLVNGMVWMALALFLVWWVRIALGLWQWWHSDEPGNWDAVILSRFNLTLFFSAVLLGVGGLITGEALR